MSETRATYSVARDYADDLIGSQDQGIPLTPAQLAWRDQRRAPGTSPTPRPVALARSALHGAIRQAREFDAGQRFLEREFPTSLPACVRDDLDATESALNRRVAEAAKELERALGGQADGR